MPQIRVNVTTKVNRASIRKETHNGREYIIAPSFTLPSNVVMNKILYPQAEIDAHYRGLENTIAPLGHPMVNGEFVSAFSPEGLALGYCGASNKNVKKVGNRVSLEKWVDVLVANESDRGKRVLERLEALMTQEDVDPVHTSVAVFLEPVAATNEQKKDGYDFIAKIVGMDHDAILLDEVGAATPEQGVGMMVNADLATTIVPNASVIGGGSYRELESRLQAAATKRFADTLPDAYVWVMDFTDTHVIVQRSGGLTEEYEYSDTAGVITIGDTGQPVRRKESWTAMIANSVKQLFNRQAASPVSTPKEDEMSLTPEERAALLKHVGDTVNAVIKPLADDVATMKTNHDTILKTLTANQTAAEAAKRAEVAAVHGDLIANALTGEALDDAHKRLKTAAPLGTNSATQPVKAGAPDPTTYHTGGA